MKKLFISILLSVMATTSFAGEILRSSTDKNLNVLDRVISVKDTFSKTSALEAKMIELLSSEGMNPTRVVLILGTGNPMEENRIFELEMPVLAASKITFVKKDLLVINYTQDSFNDDGQNIIVKRSIRIKVLRNEAGSLSGKISISHL